MDKETRKRNAEARRAWREAQAVEREQDKALVLAAMRSILEDPESSSEQRIFAVAVLDKIKGYYFVPHDMRNADALIADFAKRIEEAQKKDTK